MRYLMIFLFAMVLLLPFGVRQFLTSGQPSRIDSGEVEELTLRIVTPHNQDIRREFGRAFSVWHRAKFGKGVTVEYLTPGGTNDIIRMLAARYAGRGPDANSPAVLSSGSIDIELFWGGGDSEFNRCKTLITSGDKSFSVLQPVSLPAGLLAEAFPKQSLNGVRIVDAFTEVAGTVTVGPQWVGVCLSEFGIVYNPQVFKDLNIDPPSQWADMADPRLMGFVALADPTRSGSAAVTYMMILQRAMADAEEEIFKTNPELKTLPYDQRIKIAAYRKAIENGFDTGMSQLIFIAANSRYFTDSASQVPKDVSTGDAAVGTAIDFYGRTFEEQVNTKEFTRIRYVSPVASTAITPDPIAILHGTMGKRLELSNRFIEFLLTPEAQKLWIKKPGTPGGPVERALRRPPVRSDVYTDRTDWTDKGNPFESAGGFNQRREWMGFFGDIRPVWSAAWIDAREPLRDAYRKILALPDADRRAALLKELGAIPVTLADIESNVVSRRAMEAQDTREKTSNGPYFLAKRRIDWAKKFRAHFEAVGAKAG